MSDYYPVSDSGHVYRSNRERIANWIEAYGDVQLKSPSDPPSPVDEWLGPDGTEDDYEYDDPSIPPRILLRYRDGRPDVVVDPLEDPESPYYHRSYSRSTSSSDHGHHGPRPVRVSAPNRNIYASPMPAQPEQIQILPARSNSSSSVPHHFPAPPSQAPSLAHSHSQPVPFHHSSRHPAHPAHRHPHHVPHGHPSQYAAPQPHYPPAHPAPGMGHSHSAPLPLPPPHRTDSRTAYTIPYWGPSQAPAERGRSRTHHAIREEDEGQYGDGRSRSVPRSSSHQRSRSRPGHHSDAESWYHGQERNRTVSFGSAQTYYPNGASTVHLPPSPRSGHTSLSPTSTKHSHHSYGSHHSQQHHHHHHAYPEKKGFFHRIFDVFDHHDREYEGMNPEEYHRRLVKRHPPTVHD